MALSIVAQLRDGRYEAGGLRSDVPEWPPHPGRVFCALVASATKENHWQVLRWLEVAGAPEVWAAKEYTTSRRDGFVVTNATERKATSQHRLGRTNRMKTRVSAEPADPQFALVWPGALPQPDTLRALRALARRVPYLGRTTSPVTLSVNDEMVTQHAQWTRFTPTQPGEAATVLLRVPYAGYTDRLRAGYDIGSRAWEEARAIPYTVPCLISPPSLPREPSPFSELLIFGIERGTVKPAGDSLLALTARLREAVLSRIGTDVPAQISGHGADDRRHVAYLALPHVGHTHSDGRIMGVALAVPDDLPSDGYARLWDAVVTSPLDHLRLSRSQVLRLEHPLSAPGGWGLRSQRWTAADRGGSHTWITATPVMLDRFPGRKHGDNGVNQEIHRSIMRAGYPQPGEVGFFSAAMLGGAIHRPRRDTIPAKHPLRPIVHVKITFDRPVVGPVVVGAMRYFGLGLFAPVPEAK